MQYASHLSKQLSLNAVRKSPFQRAPLPRIVGKAYGREGGPATRGGSGGGSDQGDKINRFLLYVKISPIPTVKISSLLRIYYEYID